MTVDQLKKQLQNANHSKESRDLHALLIIENKALFQKLFAIAQEVDNPISCKAMWVLEFVCRKDLTQLLPYLPEFIKTIQKVYLQPAVRPAAKICEYLIVEYYSQKPNKKVFSKLSKNSRAQIATCCFDWLIDPKVKVAAKAYSMTTLYRLGNDFDWIIPELKMNLEQNYASGSAAYKARARMILKKI